MIVKRGDPTGVDYKQYPLRLKDRRGIQPASDCFMKFGLLVECESRYNTPILPVKRVDGSYLIVQDLRAINRIVADLYPLVANSYTLLTKLSHELAWFTLLDVKDVIFCLPLSPESQLLFAYEWENPNLGRKTYLDCTYPRVQKQSHSFWKSTCYGFGTMGMPTLEGDLTTVRR